MRPVERLFVFFWYTGWDYELGDTEIFQPCTHEEVDTQILLHVGHCAKHGIKKVAIRTVDSDVDVSVDHDLHTEELWIFFGVGNHLRHIPVHADKSKAMMMFYAINECDTVSSFLDKRKEVHLVCMDCLSCYLHHPFLADKRGWYTEYDCARKIHHGHVQ